MMSEIPKIMHQTWRDNSLPSSMLACRDSWLRYHPEWEYRFYNDQDCREFVSQNYPDFAEVYNGLPMAIQRVDFFRYLVVNRIGGVYADMDILFHRNIDDLLKGKNCIFSIEATSRGRDRRNWVTSFLTR